MMTVYHELRPMTKAFLCTWGSLEKKKRDKEWKWKDGKGERKNRKERRDGRGSSNVECSPGSSVGDSSLVCGWVAAIPGLEGTFISWNHQREAALVSNVLGQLVSVSLLLPEKFQWLECTERQLHGRLGWGEFSKAENSVGQWAVHCRLQTPAKQRDGQWGRTLMLPCSGEKGKRRKKQAHQAADCLVGRHWLGLRDEQISFGFCPGEEASVIIL